MTPFNPLPILPLIVLGASACVSLALLSWRRRHGLVLASTLVGLAASVASLPFTAAAVDRQVTPLIRMDGFALFMFVLLAGAAAVVALLSHAYLDKRRENPEEFYVLLQTATLGSAVLAASTHFASFFLGLETLSISLYALISYSRTQRLCVEAGVKYLMLAGATSGFLLFGMALLYAETGTLQFAELATRLATATPGGMIVTAGLALLVVGVGFKLALVPFHLWTPDVYQGAPAPVTAFIATVSKGGMVAAVVRLLMQIGLPRESTIFIVLSAIAAASMLAGNLLALLQTNVKRILAYSSIAHFGYVLVAVLADGDLALPAVTFYLLAYFVTSLAAFGVVTVLSESERDAESIADYRGLFWRSPGLATVLTVSLLSLAGIPLTAGFLGKFYVLSAGIESSLFGLAAVLAVGSAVGIYYYLRIILVMAEGAGTDPHAVEAPLAGKPWVPIAAGAVLSALVLLVVWLGVQPGAVQRLIQTAVASLT
ncbi:MAG: NADH-quinone oxidoreductase subunit N [bacterium]